MKRKFYCQDPDVLSLGALQNLHAAAISILYLDGEFMFRLEFWKVK